MRISILLRAAASALATGLAGGLTPTYEQKVTAIDAAIRAHFGKRVPKRTSDAVNDPFFAIPTTGRQGAKGRAVTLATAFGTTAVGQRNARGRSTSKIGKAPARGSRRGKRNAGWLKQAVERRQAAANG